MPTILELIKGWKDKNAKHLTVERIAKERVDIDYNNAPLVADKTYVRIWLKQMFLGKSREWFKDWHPAVESVIRLKFAGQSFECARVAAPSHEKFASGEGVTQNFVLLDLAPFPGGAVDVAVALVGLQGKDLAGQAIAVLSDFADLVSAPLSQVIQVSAKVKSGADALFGKNGDPHLWFGDTFVDGQEPMENLLRPGYIAIVGAEPKSEIRDPKREIDPRRLTVQKDKLWYQENPSAPAELLTKFDYMLLYVEGRTDRDDWRHFREIAALREQAIEAFVSGEDEKGESLKRAAVVHVMKHPDLAVFDRRNVATALRKEIDECAGAGRGASEQTRSWEEFIAALPPPQLGDTREPTFEEILGNRG